jgi:soluble lytic murein transglycosylase-like protein
MKMALLLLAVAAFAQTRESIEAQRKSAALQREALRAMLPPLRTPEPDCDPMPEEQVGPLIEAAAKARQLPSRLLRAVVEQESGLRACAVSDQGAQGLMQLMPATASDFQVKDVFDAQENLAAGAAFLRQLIEKYQGDLPRALAAYNAGPEAVERSGAVPDIPETSAYVDAILAKFGGRTIELAPLPAPAAPKPPPDPPKLPPQSPGG